MAKEGFFLLGKCEGFKKTAWKNDDSKFNYRIGISRTYEDDWGNETKDITEVDVSMADADMYEKQANQLKGQHVMVRVVPSARAGGKNGAWLSLFVPRGEKIVPQSKPALQQAG